MSKLTKEEEKELNKITQEITKEAKSVIEDYTKNPSEISGSFTQIHIDSPLLKKSLGKKKKD